MTLYFDTKVQFLDLDAVSTIARWHLHLPIFAVASFSQDRGGSVTIFHDSGEPIRDVTFPVHSISQATALCWHPDKRLLVTGWENGEIYVWSDGNREFTPVQGPHKAPVILLEFSEKGGRMVTADSLGMLTGWRCDGHHQFLTMFSQDLRETLLDITFRKTVANPVSTELSNLAKAAVAGDENALDTLTNWRPRTAARSLSHAGVQDNHCFYVAAQSGVIYYMNQGGTCTEVLKNNSVPITQILWHPKRETIVVLMEDMTVGHYMVESTGGLTELDRVKLSGRVAGNNGALTWAGTTLAIITGDITVRIWDIDTSDNYLLPMNLPFAGKTPSSTLNMKAAASVSSLSATAFGSGASKVGGALAQTSNEIFTCIAYCQDNQTLCAGTNQGNLYTWKRTTNYPIDVPENSWQLNNIAAVRGAIKQCYWGISETIKPCIMVNCISNVYVLKEQPLISFHRRNIWAVQRSANQVYVEHSCGKSTTVHADISITNLSLTELNFIVSNGRTIGTYKISKDSELSDTDKSLSIKSLQSFSAECLSLFIHDQNIICLTMNDVKIYSVGGVVLKEIFCNDNEGKPIGCDLSNHYLTIFTMNGYIKLYDVSRHDPKILIRPKCGYDLFDNFGEIITAKCNSDGTHVALTIANKSLMPDGKLYVWDFEKDNLGTYDFFAKSDSDPKDGRDGSIARLPISFHWDADDSRLLAVEARLLQQQKQKLSTTAKNSGVSAPYSGNYQTANNRHVEVHGVDSEGNGISGASGGQVTAATTTTSTSATEAAITASTAMGIGSNPLSCNSESQIYIMFTTDQCVIKELEIVNLAPGEQLLNMCAPYVVTLNTNTIVQTSLRNFKGMEDCDDATRKTVLDFSLNVAQGNMDQAFRCIRTIKSEVVWMNLAKMCVETGRLDVARYCLGHLQRAHSVKALRIAMEDDSLEQEAKVARLAIELGMTKEAERLYRKCGRYDLLNKLLQALGQIDEALKVAEQYDRIHLKNTYYRKAEMLKDAGKLKEALECYEKTQDPVKNVTHLLLEDPDMLKTYMESTTDRRMLKWWGQYIESKGDMESAFKVYQKAEDWFSQVRILCFLGQLSKADSIARKCGDKAACYHLARHLENIGKYQDAIEFYSKAGTYSNAVRICKENDYQDELWAVANAGRPRDKAIAAAYFEDCGAYKKAVELYHRAGMLHKAVEMAFASQQPETLQVIASELTSDSDPDLINRCAEFFSNIEQHQKAVQLLAKTKQFEAALGVCAEHKVPITETLAEMLTPEKGEIADDLRIKVLVQLGEILQEQGDYHTATKKFTQASDKVRAMKSLLKSGDTDKIIFFAGMSRQREVYVMAANYLQALDWQKDPKILKNIVTFYTKGQAYDSLANFYATCAQVEIDDYHDYDKALKAMHEAAKCLTKVTSSQRAADNLQKTIVEVKQVLDIQEGLQNGDFHFVAAGCRNMLLKPEKPPIRHSDILAMLIQALIGSQQYSEALGVLKELAVKDPSWSLRELIPKSMIERLAKECNLDIDSIWNTGRKRYADTGEMNDETGTQADTDEIQEEFE